MKGTGYTKGEWTAEDYGSVFSGEELICDTFITGNKHDAHLIAAAPKMYAMLEECAIMLRDGTQEHAEECTKQVEKLLAEARGEL